MLATDTATAQAERSPVYVERLSYLRRLLQIGNILGFDRGLCVDRYYIERFLSAHTQDVRGSVLEIGDDTYTQRFGGVRVTGSDVLHKTRDNPNATIVADLTCANHIAKDAFDCIILTQTLQLLCRPPFTSLTNSFTIQKSRSYADYMSAAVRTSLFSWGEPVM